MTQNDSTPIGIVGAYFGALAAGRVEDALAFLDTEVEWHQPGQNRFSGVHTGPDSVYQLIGGMMAVSRGTFAVAPTGPLMANGNLVAAPVHFSGSRDGLEFDQEGLDLFTVGDGKITVVRLFSSDGRSEDEFWGSKPA